MARARWMIVSIVLSLLLLASGCRQQEPQGGASSPSSRASGSPHLAVHEAGKVEVDLFIMSKCPYGVAMTQALLPALEKVGERVSFTLGHVGQVMDDGSLRSLNGEPELSGNRGQLCVVRHAPQSLLPFLACQMQGWESIPENTLSCVDELSIDRKLVQNCVDGEEGHRLLTESMGRATQVGALGSPTLRIGGSDYLGAPGTQELLGAICAAYPQGQESPPVCQESIGQELPVTVMVLEDKRCTACDVSPVLDQLSADFPSLQLVRYDWSEEAGRKLYHEGKLRYLPAVLFDHSVENHPEGLRRIAKWLEQTGPYHRLRVDARFDPRAEICDNGVDDTGNGLVDCQDPDCQESWICRPTLAGDLKLFLGGRCPKIPEVAKVLREVAATFQGELEGISVHFIVLEDGDRFRAHRGQEEVEDSLRGACVMEIVGRWERVLDYLSCRSATRRKSTSPADWKECLVGEEFSPKVVAAVARCANGEQGRRLLAADARRVWALAIKESPSWLINNRHSISGHLGDMVQDGICQFNPDFQRCDTMLPDGENTNHHGGHKGHGDDELFHMHGPHCNH